MAEVSAAVLAHDFDPFHAVAVIFFLLNVLCLNRLPEARPAATGVEFGRGREQISTTTNTLIGTFFVFEIILSCEWPFGGFLSAHRVLRRGQLRAPFFISFFNFIVHRTSFAEVSLQSYGVSLTLPTPSLVGD